MMTDWDSQWRHHCCRRLEKSVPQMSCRQLLFHHRHSPAPGPHSLDGHQLTSHPAGLSLVSGPVVQSAPMATCAAMAWRQLRPVAATALLGGSST